LDGPDEDDDDDADDDADYEEACLKVKLKQWLGLGKTGKKSPWFPWEEGMEKPWFPVKMFHDCPIFFPTSHQRNW
jgi:hypothetical protein